MAMSTPSTAGDVIMRQAASGASQSQSGGNSSMFAVSQLFARLSQEIQESKPNNCIHFIVDFLCKHYPEHLHGFASIWQMDPDLEHERHEVVNFFKSHKISTSVAAHFTNAGYDTLDTLTTLSPDSLVDVEAFNNVKWLPGHKVRLQQIFSEISGRARAYRQQQLSKQEGQAATSHVPAVHNYVISGASTPQVTNYRPANVLSAPPITKLPTSYSQVQYAPQSIQSMQPGGGLYYRGLSQHEFRGPGTQMKIA